VSWSDRLAAVAAIRNVKGKYSLFAAPFPSASLDHLRPGVVFHGGRQTYPQELFFARRTDL
jgi:hypothetical protein